jgi:Arylsulfotransferase (ASST)
VLRPSRSRTDAGWQNDAMTIMSLYDNGKTRLERCDPNAHSRGYVMNIDEANMQATPTLMADLGVYSKGLGSARLFPNGNYHFESGWVFPGNTSQTLEVTPNASFVFELNKQSVTYRSFRMRDLYTPADFVPVE